MWWNLHIMLIRFIRGHSKLLIVITTCLAHQLCSNIHKFIPQNKLLLQLAIYHRWFALTACVCRYLYDIMWCVTSYRMKSDGKHQLFSASGASVCVHMCVVYIALWWDVGESQRNSHGIVNFMLGLLLNISCSKVVKNYKHKHHAP